MVHHRLSRRKLLGTSTTVVGVGFIGAGASARTVAAVPSTATARPTFSLPALTASLQQAMTGIKALGCAFVSFGSL